jgi:hypothetical protein
LTGVTPTPVLLAHTDLLGGHSRDITDFLDQTHMAKAVSERSHADQLQLQVVDARHHLEDLKSAYDAKIKASSKQLTMLAMNTGVVYAKTPIWDCGKRQ